jgi:hypothetical protein
VKIVCKPLQKPLSSTQRPLLQELAQVRPGCDPAVKEFSQQSEPQVYLRTIFKLKFRTCISTSKVPGISHPMFMPPM